MIVFIIGFVLGVCVTMNLPSLVRVSWVVVAGGLFTFCVTAGFGFSGAGFGGSSVKMVSEVVGSYNKRRLCVHICTCDW